MASKGCSARTWGSAAAAFLLLVLAAGPVVTGVSAQTAPPDLVVTDMQVNSACYVVVTVKNQGGPLPVGASPALQFYKGTAADGGWTVGGSNLGPGGTLQWTRPGSRVIGTAAYRVVASPGTGVTDAQPANNTLDRTLTCNPKLPDLQVAAIEFTPDCRTRVRLVNAGDAPVEDVVLTTGYGARLARSLDDRPAEWVWLGVIDPTKQLKAPGGTLEWVDYPQYRATAKVGFTLWDVREEQSATNNTRQVSVPQACAAAPAQTAPPDLVVTDMQVNSACYVVVTVKNQGGPLPVGASPALQFYKGTAADGGWTVGGSNLGPGGTLQWTRPGSRVIGTAAYRVVASPGTGVTDAQPANNTLDRTLTCNPKLPDLQVAAIDFTPDCRTRVRLVNAGDAPVEDVVLTTGYGARLARSLDDRPADWLWLGNIDPNKQLKAPGGTLEWVDYPQYRATAKVGFTLWDVREEKDSANNTRQAALPSACTQAGAPRPAVKQAPPLTPPVRPQAPTAVPGR